MMDSREGVLLAHVADLVSRAESGEIVTTPFLTPREQNEIRKKYAFLGDRLRFLGGYAEAERCRAVFLPSYMAELDGEVRETLLAEETGETLVALSVMGSGYRELSHRDYLGSILNLGLERDAIGDIAVLSPHDAVLFCDRLIATFLTENLTRAARDAVKVRVVELPPDFNGGRKFEPVSDTVASPRADAVVAALCNLSRERAQALFAQGFVELDYEPLEKYDREVGEGAVLTVRSHGKFIVRSLSDKTKKGRYRLLADRYV